MTKQKISVLLTTLGFAAQFVSGQLEPDCNPLHADCPAKKAWPDDSYYIDFTKATGLPDNWIIGSQDVVNFSPEGVGLTYGKKGDAPSMWTDFYMLGGRYDVEMQIAPGQGVISSSTLWSDTQDEIGWEFSGNQHGEKPFPPADGMWTFQTSIFAQGEMWNGAAKYQKDAHNPTTEFHTYSVEWDEHHVDWYVDNKVVRSVQASDTPSGFTFPQSPMKLQLGVWGGGESENSFWTTQWAGGEIDMKGAPYTMYVRSVRITNKYPACEYRYKDKSGKVASIDRIQGDCSSSASSPAASPKIARSYIVESPPPKGTVGIKSYSAVPVSPAPSYLASSESSSHLSSSSSSSQSSPSSPSSPAGYIVSSRSSSASPSQSSTSSKVAAASDSSSPASSPAAPSQSSTTPKPVSPSSSPYPGSSPASASQSSTTPKPASAGAPSYPNVPQQSTSKASQPATASTQQTSIATPPASSSSTSSTGGLLSSLSSLIMGTSSKTSASAIVSSSVIPGSYPVHSGATLITASGSPVVSSSPVVATSVSNSVSSLLSSSSVGPASKSPSTTAGSITPSSPAVGTGSSSVQLSSSSSVPPIVPNVPGSGYPLSPGANATKPAASSVSTFPVSQVSSGIQTSSSAAAVSDSTPVSQSGSSIPSVSSSPSGSQPASSSILSSSVSTGEPSPSSGVSSLSSSSPLQSSTTSSSQVMPSTYTFSSEITTSLISTVYSTNLITITSCAPTVTNCPVGHVTTETISLYTTVCPVTNTIIDDKTFTGQINQVTSSAAPMASSIPASSVSSPASSSHPVLSISSSTQSPGPSVGNSSTVQLSSTIYKNTTMPGSDGSASATETSPGSSSAVASSTSAQLTTSTVYSTNVYTITSCAPTVTNCPARIGQVTTELVSLYTTICPVKSAETASPKESSVPASSPGSSSSPTPKLPGSSPSSSSPTSSALPRLTTATVYTSSVATITSCLAHAIDCSKRLGSVFTENIPLYTTIYPVEETTSSVPTKPTASAVSPSSGASSSSTLPNTFSSGTTTTTITSHVPLYTTSTVYSTNIYTLTSCAPDMKGEDCSSKLGAVTTEIIPVSTTICPVTASPSPTTPSQYPSGYSTTEVTLSNTFSNSVIVITSMITFIDTPAAHTPTPTTSTTAKAVDGPGGSVSTSKQPCTTLTLGNHFTTVITYASLTTQKQTPASVSSGKTATSYYTVSSPPAQGGGDVPSYTLSKGAPGTLTMSSSSVDAITKPTAPAAAPAPGPNHGGPDSGSGSGSGPGEVCNCVSTVYMTVTTTVAQTTVTSTKTVEPPFPNSYGTGMSSSSTAPMGTGTGIAMRRWFRRAQGGHEHGHGHD